MSKKLTSLFMAIIFVLSMTTMAFAAAPTVLTTKTGDNEVTQTAKPYDASEDERSINETAPQVSSVTILGGYIDASNHVIIQVKVMGYGNYTASWDGNTAKYLGWYNTVGTNPVTGWYENFDCGTATIGTHTFKITARSVNFPNGSVSASESFTIS